MGVIYRDIRDQTIEIGFEQFYGSPWLRAFLGLDDQSVTQQQLLDRDVALQEELKTLRQQIELLQINEGGTEEALARLLIYMAAGSMPDLTQTRLVVADEYGAHAVKPPKPQQQTAEQKVVASTPVAKRTPSKSTRKHSAKTPLKAAKKTKS